MMEAMEVKLMSEKYSLKNLLKQRRVWAAFLSAIAVIGMSMGEPTVAGICTALAGTLGLRSYIAPKELSP